MNIGGRYGKATLGLVLGLWIVPACGRDGMDASRDGGLDLPNSDTTPSPVEDLAPPQPDLPNTPDLPPNGPELGPNLPDLRPATDPPIARDLPADAVYLADRTEVFATEVGRDSLADRNSDLPVDLRYGPDIRNIDTPPFDTRPAYDQNPSPDELPAKLDALNTPDAPGASRLCTASGGTVATRQCCSGAADFAETCTTGPGACACSPENSRAVSYCACPSTACYLPGIGCVGPGSVCTVGADQTCNDSSFISSIHGRCIEGGRCLCTTTYALSATSGKCL